MPARPVSLIAVSFLLLPLEFVATAAPAAAEPPASTFGSHVSACAQASNGFGGEMNPSHHRGPGADSMTGMPC